MELSNQLNEVRGEYETLCVEFEHTKAANDQAGIRGSLSRTPTVHLRSNE